MNSIKVLTLFNIIFFLFVSQNETQACSMYKVTIDGKTMVGCNEDAWRTTSRIWFRNARDKNEYGAGFTGSRQVSTNQFAPQSGMNEVGLTFSRLTSYHPQKSELSTKKEKVTHELPYLTDILHTCATVEDVKKYIEQYDHSLFINDVFIYVDSSGKYLVVEPYELILGNNPNYVLANFCPSITTNEKARKLARYRDGVDFLNTHKVEASLSFCTNLSDAMAVCRNKKGDGTLLTSIWDTKNNVVNLFFYHQYDSAIQFDLSEELAKGNHMLNVASLFPPNHEFERLSTFKTPFNVPSLRVLLVIIGGVLTLLSLILLFYSFKERAKTNTLKNSAFFAVLNILLTGYLFVLATNINIYYFDAPYQHYSSKLISLSSYIPFLLLLVIIPLMVRTFNFGKNRSKKNGLKNILIFNNLMYILCLFGFSYWGLLLL
jgi:hypothetical protein